MPDGKAHGAGCFPYVHSIHRSEQRNPRIARVALVCRDSLTSAYAVAAAGTAARKLLQAHRFCHRCTPNHGWKLQTGMHVRRAAATRAQRWATSRGPDG